MELVRLSDSLQFGEGNLGGGVRPRKADPYIHSSERGFMLKRPDTSKPPGTIEWE